MPDPAMLKDAIRHISSLEERDWSWVALEGRSEAAEIIAVLKEAGLLEHNNELNDEGKSCFSKMIRNLKNDYKSMLKRLA